MNVLKAADYFLDYHKMNSKKHHKESNFRSFQIPWPFWR